MQSYPFIHIFISACSNYKRFWLEAKTNFLFIVQKIQFLWCGANCLCYCLCGMLNSECHMCLYLLLLSWVGSVYKTNCCSDLEMHFLPGFQLLGIAGSLCLGPKWFFVAAASSRERSVFREGLSEFFREFLWAFWVSPR